MHLKKYIYALAFGLVASHSSQAQFTKDNSEFTDAPDGTVLFELNEGQFIWSELSETMWYKGSKRVVFTIDQMTADSTLPAGVTLLNENMEEIGKTISEVPIEEVLELGGFRRDEYRTGILRGFVNSFDLKVNSRPEQAIAKALKEERGSAGQILEPLLAEYPFEYHEGVDGYDVYVLRNMDAENHEEDFPFRILIVMRGSSSLICTVSRHEFIDGKRYKAQEETLSGFYTWYQRPNPRLLDSVDEIVYSYLPL